MPRDDYLQAEYIVDVPGGRSARIIETGQAGVFAAVLVGQTWLDRLAGLGWLSDAQRAAGEHLADLFHQTSLQPRVTGSLQPKITATADDHGLEALNAEQHRAWRALGRLLAVVAPADRVTVEQTVLWDMAPHDIRGLQRGLSAVARRLHGRPRR